MSCLLIICLGQAIFFNIFSGTSHVLYLQYGENPLLWVKPITHGFFRVLRILFYVIVNVNNHFSILQKASLRLTRICVLVFP